MRYPKGFKNHLSKKKRIKILMVDDHPMILSGYESSLTNHFENNEWDIVKAHNCDEALNFLQKSVRYPFEVVLLDINLPPSIVGDIKNGEDLGQKIKRNHPGIKIIVLTMLSDPLRIKNILKNLNPEGFIAKIEITPELLYNAIQDVLVNKAYYCKVAKKSLPLKISNNEILTDLDREILYFISIGEKMKNLPNHIPLSMASIERRKKNMKIFFDISEGSNYDLIRLAREKGYL